MNPLNYEHGLLVSYRNRHVGELVCNKGPFCDVRWLTGPHKGKCYIELTEYLDILSPEEEAMYRLAQLGRTD
jgi:hypothetical protein